jgi:hypothetical protein
MYILLFCGGDKISVAKDEITNEILRFESENEAEEFILNKEYLGVSQYMIVGVDYNYWKSINTLLVSKRVKWITIHM